MGWLIDVFLIPGMDHDADTKYVAGPINYNVAWLLLTFLGPLGLHRFYMGKFISGAFYLLTLGWLYIGVVYDFFTLNGQVSARNREVLARD